MNHPPRPTSRTLDDEAILEAYFDHGDPPVGEAEIGALDEWSTSMVTARSYTAEVSRHLGGPQQRVHSAMPARTVAIRRAEVTEPEQEEPAFPRAVSDLDRSTTSRRNTAAKDVRVSGWIVATFLLIVMLMVVILLVLAGGR